MTQDYSLKRPIFGVDCAAYGSNLISKYLPRFLRELIGDQPKTYRSDDRFFLFRYGQFVRSQAEWRDLI